MGAKTGVLCTREIQKTIDLLDEAGGGTVVIPEGIFLSGTLELKNVSIFLEKGAVLKGSSEISDYYANSFIHNEMKQTISLLYAMNRDNISISGEGTIDLNSDAFFEMCIRDRNNAGCALKGTHKKLRIPENGGIPQLFAGVPSDGYGCKVHII